MPHIAQMLERNARRTPEREALIYRDRRLNYAQLDAESNRAARAWSRRKRRASAPRTFLKGC